MELTKKELESYKPLNNQVLIKITRKTNEIEYKSLKLYFDNSYDNYRNAVVTGEVLAVPDKLDCETSTIMYLTDMELQKGDTVWFHYMAYVNAMPGPNQDILKYIQIDGEEWYCILVNYDSIYVAKRKEEIIPINGYVIIAPLEGEDIWKSKVLQYSQLTKDRYRYSETFGVVKYIGKPIEAYRMNMHAPDDPNVNIGDIVAIDNACDIPFEVDLHRTFEREEKTPYYRVLRKDILGVVSHVN